MLLLTYIAGEGLVDGIKDYHFLKSAEREEKKFDKCLKKEREQEMIENAKSEFIKKQSQNQSEEEILIEKEKDKFRKEEV